MAAIGLRATWSQQRAADCSYLNFSYCKLQENKSISSYRSLPGKCSWAFIFQCRFSSYWGLTLCTGHLPCVKIEVGGVNVAATIILCARVRACYVARGGCARVILHHGSEVTYIIQRVHEFNPFQPSLAGQPFLRKN